MAFTVAFILLFLPYSAVQGTFGPFFPQFSGSYFGKSQSNGWIPLTGIKSYPSGPPHVYDTLNTEYSHALYPFDKYHFIRIPVKGGIRVVPAPKNLELLKGISTYEKYPNLRHIPILRKPLLSHYGRLHYRDHSHLLKHLDKPIITVPKTRHSDGLIRELHLKNTHLPSHSSDLSDHISHTGISDYEPIKGLKSIHGSHGYTITRPIIKSHGKHLSSLISSHRKEHSLPILSHHKVSHIEDSEDEHVLTHGHHSDIGHEITHDHPSDIGHDLHHDHHSHSEHDLHHDHHSHPEHDLHHDHHSHSEHDLHHDHLSHSEHDLHHDHHSDIGHGLVHSHYSDDGHDLIHTHHSGIGHDVSHSHHGDIEHELIHSHHSAIDHDLPHIHDSDIEHDYHHIHDSPYSEIHHEDHDEVLEDHEGIDRGHEVIEHDHEDIEHDHGYIEHENHKVHKPDVKEKHDSYSKEETPKKEEKTYSPPTDTQHKIEEIPSDEVAQKDHVEEYPTHPHTNKYSDVLKTEKKDEKPHHTHGGLKLPHHGYSKMDAAKINSLKGIFKRYQTSHHRSHVHHSKSFGKLPNKYQGQHHIENIESYQSYPQIPKIVKSYDTVRYAGGRHPVRPVTEIVEQTHYNSEQPLKKEDPSTVSHGSYGEAPPKIEQQEQYHEEDYKPKSETTVKLHSHGHSHSDSYTESHKSYSSNYKSKPVLPRGRTKIYRNYQQPRTSSYEVEILHSESSDYAKNVPAEKYTDTSDPNSNSDDTRKSEPYASNENTDEPDGFDYLESQLSFAEDKTEKQEQGDKVNSKSDEKQ
ncbi:uncharacterized protein TNCV_3681831 [Trichonephila clavipes]|uniref:Uncharacterized protein n=1 Tax=Trichonephila clavipes TaxID=2585209 RepID=A0A8X6RFH1_TRICX|nr:uncharacterized protein TNCV_3681831 [Trichonephila clavipes]